MKINNNQDDRCLYCGEKDCTNIWHIHVWIKKPKMLFAFYGVGIVLMLVIAAILTFFWSSP
ncbi:hypothetical protein JN12_03965 [Geobacter argillaceus]|uniref:Uncharacterized protein n=1 Tax=Geobacter argillaceus TaxID=345631 RepID=A0A562V5Y2_9BACT|nr:hypothetical protein JN12_03965 [Geobacter argillaceus]